MQNAARLPSRERAALVVRWARNSSTTAPVIAGPASSRVNLVGFPRGQLVALVEEACGMSADMAAHLHRAVHDGTLKHLLEFDRVSAARAKELSKYARIDHVAPALREVSHDGTIKWTMGLADGANVETVFIPETSANGAQRGVLCVSSQVGCSLACTFCHTGTQRLRRNLEPSEIVGQLLAAGRNLRSHPPVQSTTLLHQVAGGVASPDGDGNRTITNVVFMGQGEPLHNWRSVSAAVRVFTDPFGCGIAPKRVTVSTAGVAPLIPRIGTELKVNLAVSLHAPTAALRTRLMPLNRSYPLATLMEACKRYSDSRSPKPRRVMWEYALLSGVNDSEVCAQQLAALANTAGFPVSVNLIAYNPWPGTPYEPSSDAAIRSFAQVLTDAGVLITIRWPRGRDISAACGQLTSAGLATKVNHCATPTTGAAHTSAVSTSAVP